MAHLTDKHLALARRGDLEGVRRTVEADPGLLAVRPDAHGRTLLWEAVRFGHEDLVSFLAERGAPVDVPGRHRAESFVLLTPLCVARWRGRDGLAGKLESLGARLSVYDAAFLGDLAAVRSFVAADPPLIDRSLPEDTLWQTTPLHYAASGVQMEVARFLCEQGADVPAHGPLLLEIAARRGSRELVELFLGHGADARQVKAYAALVGGRGAELLPLLVSRGLKVNQDEFGYPALVYASRGDKGEHPDWIEALLGNGAHVNVRDRKGRTALHAAAEAGFCRVAKVLLGAGAEVNARCHEDRTPLWAAQRKRRLHMEALLESCGGAV